VHSDDRATVQCNIETALASGREFNHEERILRPDGEIRHLYSIGEVMRDEAGQPLCMLCICLDVTERKLAESALRESEQNYQLLKHARD